MDTWLAIALIAVVVAIGLVVLAVAALRFAGAMKRLLRASGRTGTRFADEAGLLRARRAALRVAVAERKVRNTDSTPPQVTSLKGRQEKDLIG
jgi:hypothetical protein